MERREASDMKTMTCKDLTGACDLEFHAETFGEIAEMSKNMEWKCSNKATKPTPTRWEK